ncbi:unnamed protein product [Ilex paraguariensis]|uniref:Calcium-transporting ATPase n=1 Tax=Ilex paraguariensis TaxID=185542 RepID=A0ABC8SLV5_9AQUA
MSKEPADERYDLEAQHEPFLMSDETPSPNPSPSPTQILGVISQLIRSAHIFLAAANIGGRSPSFSRVSSSSPTYSPLDGSYDAKEEHSEIIKLECCLPEQALNVGSGGELQLPQHSRITEIVKGKRLQSLHDFGGVREVAEALNTDLDNGISGDDEDIIQRQTRKLCQIQPPALTFTHFLLEATNNYTIFLLSLAAILSFAFGMKEEGPENGWFDGVIVAITVVVLIIFTSTQKYWEARRSRKKEKQKPSPKGKEMEIEVIRAGDKSPIHISELVCGDIVYLKRGSQVPADGLFVDGQGLVLDDGLKSFINDQNPFLFYGAMVINGDARMIVTSVGEDTQWGATMRRATNSPDKKTKLEARLDKLSTCIHTVGLLITILMLVVLFLRFVLRKIDDENGFRPESKGEPTATRTIINAIKKIIVEQKGTARALTTLLSVSLVGIMEGLPFVVSLAITYWNHKTMSDKATEQEFLACVSMASVTTICTDTIGGLTEHSMEVDKLFIGEKLITESFLISPFVFELLSEGIGMSILIPESDSSVKESVHSWAAEKLGMLKETLERHCTVMNIERGPDSDDQELCGMLVEKNRDGRKDMYSHWNGPGAKILAMCSDYYDYKGEKHAMDDQKRVMFERVDKEMVGKNWKTIAFACKKTDAPTLEANGLTLLGLLGLKNTSREDIKKAIDTSKAAGVKTIIVSGHDVSELETIANKFGLLNSDSNDLALTGEEFRNYNDEERRGAIDRVRVMGNSEPSDKLLLVKCLKEKGEVVAYVGQLTNDAPALKEADIGLTMGTWSSDKARENSDIIIWDGNFSFVVYTIKCGKCLYENIQKFIQVELIMTISSLLINFIGIGFLGDAPLTTLQLFWVNLVVAFVGGCVVLTGPPTERQMNNPPLNKAKSLITKAMWRNTLTQASYQIATLVTLQHKGNAIPGISGNVKKSMIFNCFVLCQFFNLFTARELEEMNFFRGLKQNHWFWVALGVFMVLHVGFVLVTGAGLKWILWLGCFLIAVASLLIDCAGKHVSQMVFTGNSWSRIRSIFGRMSNPSSLPSESVPNLHHPVINQSS